MPALDRAVAFLQSPTGLQEEVRMTRKQAPRSPDESTHRESGAPMNDQQYAVIRIACQGELASLLTLDEFPSASVEFFNSSSFLLLSRFGQSTTKTL
jgi:hypothetical protein